MKKVSWAGSSSRTCSQHDRRSSRNAAAKAAGPAAQGERQGGAPRRTASSRGRGAFQPTLWWGDEMFPKWPYPAGDAVYADLDGMKIKGYINEITAISRKSRDDGNQYLGPHHRLALRQDDDRLGRRAVQAHRPRDVACRNSPTCPPQWWPTSWEVTAAAAARRSR